MVTQDLACNHTMAKPSRLNVEVNTTQKMTMIVGSRAEDADGYTKLACNHTNTETLQLQM
jgi:hypothetical protein